MRIRIVSDGTGPGTHILNAETGENLNMHVTGIWWGIDSPGFLGRVRLEIAMVAAEVEGELEQTIANYPQAIVEATKK